VAKIKLAKTVDDLILLKNVIVSCTIKDGLVSNKRSDGSAIEGVPECGLLGFIAEKNPGALFISTGGTFKLVSQAGLNVIEMSAYTGYPEMETGLVKSLHPKIHAGILGHRYTEEDAAFMHAHEIASIDAVIANFYPLNTVMQEADVAFETVRQAIDVGGPTMSHSARKAFISTALVTDPGDYHWLVDELEKNAGAVSLKTRLELAKRASLLVTEFVLSVDQVVQNLQYADLEEAYEIL